MLSRVAEELSKGGGTVVLLHGNADPDALASAYAVQRSFPEVSIWVPGGLDRVAKVLSEELSIETSMDSSSLPRARLLVLDTSGPEQVPEGIDFSDAIVVDHHTRNAKWDSTTLYYCDDGKSSCSEIVYELLKLAKKDLPREVAMALMLGIITDTGFFKYARPAALVAFAELMSTHSLQMDEVVSLVDLETDVSEKISQLRGAQRLRYWKVGDHMVAISQGSAFEASVCKAIIMLGADIVFVGSQRGDNFRVSARATQAMVRKGVHLGKLLGSVGSETSNGGGGHPGAAGITGVGDVEAILNISAEHAMKFLKRLDSSGDR